MLTMGMYMSAKKPRRPVSYAKVETRPALCAVAKHSSVMLPIAQRSAQPFQCSSFFMDETDKPYLERYLYAPLDGSRWLVPPGLERSGPQLYVRIHGHSEIDGHTFYQLQCGLLLCGSRILEWMAPRRLLSLREGLHDPLKTTLGSDYVQHFAGAPFARRGGLPGTTQRLQAWFGALAEATNSGRCSPGVVAFVLQFLDTPPPDQSPSVPVLSSIAMWPAGSPKIWSYSVDDIWEVD